MTTTRPPNLLPLSGLALIRVRGADAAAFLDGQLTQQVGDLDADHSALAAWCDAKGRALTLLRVWRANDEFILQLPTELVEPVLDRLRMYVLRSRVELDDAGSNLSQYGLCTDDPHGTLAGQIPVPASAGDVCRRDALTVLALPGQPLRYCLIGEPQALDDLRSQLPVADEIQAERDWRLAGIRAGLPQIHAATQQLFVPQMLNLHWLGGVDFHKGCYPGQEVVARLQFRGKLKRRLFRAGCAAAAVPGDLVLATDGSREGIVVDAALADSGGHELLAVLRVAAVATDLVIDGKPLTLLDLPYPNS